MLRVLVLVRLVPMVKVLLLLLLVLLVLPALLHAALVLVMMVVVVMVVMVVAVRSRRRDGADSAADSATAAAAATTVHHDGRPCWRRASGFRAAQHVIAIVTVVERVRPLQVVEADRFRPVPGARTAGLGKYQLIVPAGYYFFPFLLFSHPSLSFSFFPYRRNHLEMKT